MPVKVSYQADKTRLIGADRKQSGLWIYLDYRHLKRACGVERFLVYPVLHLDVVGTDSLHALQLLIPSVIALSCAITKQRRPHEDVVCVEKRCGFSLDKGLYDAELACGLDGLCAAIYVELAIGGFDVITHRVQGNEQLLSNFFVFQSLCHQAQHL